MRDNFTQRVKLVVSQRCGMRCSNPECRRATIGPHTHWGKVVNIGVVAHISAATPGGPRYDTRLTSDERRSIENAIWLCQTCARVIDADPKTYTTELLKKWKADAERLAFATLTTFQDAAWPDEIKHQCHKLLKACDEADTTNAKGQSLENLIEVPL